MRLTQADPVLRVKIDGVPKDYADLPMGRAMEHGPTIKRFKDAAKITHVSVKRRTFAAAWKEFTYLYRPSQWYAKWNGADDSFQVFYL